MARSDQSAARDGVGRRGARSAREGVILVAMGVALLCVAAWSAARAKVGDSSPDIPTDVGGGEAVLNDALLIVAGALVAVLVIFVVPAWLRQGRGRGPSNADDEPRRIQFWLGLLGGVTVILAIALLILLLAHDRSEQLVPPLAGAPATTEPVENTDASAPVLADGPRPRCSLSGAIAVGAVVAVLYLRGRGGGATDDVEHLVPPQPNTPLDLESLAPADAVRAAYAARATCARAVRGLVTRPRDPVRVSRPRAARPRPTSIVRSRRSRASSRSLGSRITR